MSPRAEGLLWGLLALAFIQAPAAQWDTALGSIGKQILGSVGCCGRDWGFVLIFLDYSVR